MGCPPQRVDDVRRRLAGAATKVEVYRVNLIDSLVKRRHAP